MGKIHDALQRAETLRRRGEEAPLATDIVAADLAPVARAEPKSRTSWRARFRRTPSAKQVLAESHAGVLVGGTGSPYSEEYRTLRARIQSLRRSRELRSIVLSSARPSEGKTTTAVNLALSFGAERENSVCLVDADLRTPRVHKSFAGTGIVGLAEVLEGDAKLEEALVPVPDSRLMVLPVKALPTAPSELLSSRAMIQLVAELHTRFQTVIFDAPPVLGLPDTVTLVDLPLAARGSRIGARETRCEQGDRRGAEPLRQARDRLPRRVRLREVLKNRPKGRVRWRSSRQS
jgi:capsular exopolysaccharide synthesis family protein